MKNELITACSRSVLFSEKFYKQVKLLTSLIRHEPTNNCGWATIILFVRTIKFDFVGFNKSLLEWCNNFNLRNKVMRKKLP